jgi:hypothetical protein
VKGPRSVVMTLAIVVAVRSTSIATEKLLNLEFAVLI